MKASDGGVPARVLSFAIIIRSNNKYQEFYYTYENHTRISGVRVARCVCVCVCYYMIVV